MDNFFFIELKTNICDIIYWFLIQWTEICTGCCTVHVYVVIHFCDGMWSFV